MRNTNRTAVNRVVDAKSIDRVAVFANGLLERACLLASRLLHPGSETDGSLATHCAPAVYAPTAASFDAPAQPECRWQPERRQQRPGMQLPGMLLAAAPGAWSSTRSTRSRALTSV